MSKTTSFAELGKDTSDLLNTGFPVNGSVKVSHEIEPLKGLVVKSSLINDTHGPITDSTKDKNKPKGVNAVFEDNFKFNLGTYPVAFKGKAESVNSVTEGSLAVSNLIVPGTELKPWVKRNQNRDDATKMDVSGGVQVGFSNEHVNVSLKTKTPRNFSKHELDASFVGQYPKGLYWGLNCKYTHVVPKAAEAEDPEAPKPAKAVSAAPSGPKKPNYELAGKIHLVRDDSSFTIALETPPEEEQTLSFTWGQTLPSGKVATSFAIPRGKEPPTASVVYESKWDDSTTVKSKLTVSQDSRLKVAYTQAVGASGFVTATLGADINANALIGVGGGEPNAFGFELKLK